MKQPSSSDDRIEIEDARAAICFLDFSSSSPISHLYYTYKVLDRYKTHFA